MPPPRAVSRLPRSPQDYVIYAKLDEVERELADEAFIRIHNRYLVNSRQFSYVGSDSIQIHSMELPFSRSHKRDATQALARQMVKE